QKCGDVSQILSHGEVVVIRGALRAISGHAPQLSRTGGLAEHGYRASLRSLHADHRTHERGLTAPGRTQQTRDLPARDRYIQPVEDAVLPPPHPKLGDLDCLSIRHVLIVRPDRPHGKTDFDRTARPTSSA